MLETAPSLPSIPPRRLGLLVTCGFERVSLAGDLRIGAALGVSAYELLPHWRALPGPAEVRARLEAAGCRARSVHGGWGSQAIRADRIDLSSLDAGMRRASIDDIKRCVDWALSVGAEILVVHPGGLSDPADAAEHRAALVDSLTELSIWTPAGVALAIENMPPGVHPGSRMADLAEIVTSVGHPALGLIGDTGHARMVSSAEEETMEARGGLLVSTHVHDNDGRRDLHAIPGEGVIDWPAWTGALDRVGYRGPLILECIRALRERSEADLAGLAGSLARLLGTTA